MTTPDLNSLPPKLSFDVNDSLSLVVFQPRPIMAPLFRRYSNLPCARPLLSGELCREIASQDPQGLSSVIFSSPDLFQEAALFQIVYEAVVVDLLGFSSDGRAAFAGDLDGIGDGFTGDDHRTVEDFPGVHVVSGL